MDLRDRDIWLPKIQTPGMKAALAIIARINAMTCHFRTSAAKSSCAASISMYPLDLFV